MTQYGRSPWTDRFPRSRVPSFPRLRGRHEIDAVVIGGGLTGCATAYAFAAAGIKVALIEAAQIGRGASALSTGWISDDPGASFAAAEQLIGRRAARHAWQSWRRAALDFTALIRRLDVKCQLEPRPTLIAATTPEQAAQLKREQKVRKEAGLDAPSLNAKAILAEAAIQAAGGIRTEMAQRSIRTVRRSAWPPRRPIAALRSSRGPPPGGRNSAGAPLTSSSTTAISARSALSWPPADRRSSSNRSSGTSGSRVRSWR